MARSFPDIRRKMDQALASIREKEIELPCDRDPVLFTEVRQSPQDAQELCSGCPLLEGDICLQFGYTEGSNADGMVYGGRTWRRGKPLPAPSLYV